MVTLDQKIKTVRFIGELAKFGILQENSPEKILQHLKQSLLTFWGDHVEVISNLLDCCGRYLVNTLEGENKQRILDDLDMMWRLKEKQRNLSQQ